MELTINLPDAVFLRLRAIADLTEQPLGDLVPQSIAGNLPPSIDSTPAEVRTELLQMQTLSIEDQDLRRIAQAQVSANQQGEHFELLDKNKSGSLNQYSGHN